MEKENISKKDLFNVIKNGHNWHAEKIKGELHKILATNSRAFNHELSYENDEKYYYIYDNECYLFVFDGKIEVRCDRENVFSEYQNLTYEIKEANDILLAYETFSSMTMEAEED
jgi:hypothetical protein